MRLQLRSLARRTLVRNTLWGLVGQGLGTLIRAAYFVVIASSLGAEEYGAFAAVLAAGSILGPLAPLGTGSVLVQNVARDPTRFPSAWGNSILVTLVTGTGLTLLLAAAHGWAFPPSIPLTLVILTAVAELLMSSLVSTAGQAFQAFQRINRTALLQVLVNGMKLVAAVILTITTPSPTALQWSALYLLSAVITAWIGVVLVNRELSAPRLVRSRVSGEVREGGYFALDAVATGSYHEIDKAMLARFATLDATGVYAAAHRLVEIALVPVRSVLFAGLPRFFQHGASGLGGSITFARRVAPMALLYALAIAAILFVVAPLIPRVFGADYSAGVQVVRWLAVIPVVKTLHLFIGDALTGAGYQRDRTYAVMATAGANVLANLWLIPRYSWLGATWSRIGTEVLLLGLLAATAWLRYRHEALVRAKVTQPR